MIIESHIEPVTLSSETTLREALHKMSEGKRQFVLLTSPKGKLEGVLTDGDVRRWLVLQNVVDLDVPASSVMSREFVSAPAEASAEKIQSLLSPEIHFIPLVDQLGRLVAIARPREDRLRIHSFELHANSPTFVIAEVGNNHNGDLAFAKRLVDEAIASGADCVKFQMRDLESLHRDQGSEDDARADLGDQYVLDLLRRFQLPQDAYAELFDYVKEKGAIPLCTPFDIKSVEQLEAYGMPAYKVASADLTNHELLKRLIRTGKPLLCSTGMSTETEIRAAVSLLRNGGAQYVLLHCNSTYPAPLEDLNLRYLDRLAELGGSLVGYSGHELGIHAALAAVARGAKVIEKHFTLDKGMEGNDHRVSLLPEEFAAMVRAIRDIEHALGSSRERSVSQGERMNREVLGKSLVITTDLPEGSLIEEHMIAIKSPGQGLAPYRLPDLIGRRARRSFSAGDFFFEDDIAGGSVAARPYTFDRPFGIPVRYHDFAAMHTKTNIDLVEFHLSHRDLDLPLARYFTGTYPYDFLVHAPELFAGDHILDLASSDKEYRMRSVAELQRVIDVTRALKSFFPTTAVPRIIVNVGGASDVTHLPESARAALYDTLRTSLRELDTAGVEIIPQTMPPYPWHFGGRRYHNLFLDPKEIREFCESEGMRVCFDVSHSKLACTQYGWSLSEFVKEIGPHIAHLHLVDAAGVDQEGLQIGEGDIDFAALAETLRIHAPTASFIPEIWQGHKNNGEGFWAALDRLEQHFARPLEREATGA